MAADHNIRLLWGVAMLGAAFGAHGQPRTSDPLADMTQCFSGGEFHYETKDRRPASATSRTIIMAAGPVQVSAIDGYRLMIYRRSTSPLVNLKIERSAEDGFAADRAAIIAQMTELVASVKPPYSKPLETATQDGIEILAINNRSLGTPGVISFYTLMDAVTRTVATAYILNQRPEVREYATEDDYKALRDRFIGALSACMARARR